MAHKVMSYRQGKEEVGRLQQQLWDQRLHDPEVWQRLVQKRESLRVLSPGVVAVMAIGVLVAILLGLFVHGLLAVASFASLVIYALKKRSKVNAERQRLRILTGPPGGLFPPIAVNKIMMEAYQRSPEVKRYINAVNAGGRHAISAFENQQFIKILGVLDRIEEE